MNILSFKSGHDGTVAGIDSADQKLLFSYEAEKNSFPRYTPVTPDTFIDAGLWFKDLPDVLALSGWSSNGSDHVTTSGAGYFGVGPGSESIGKRTFFGKSVDYYSSTHERAHIWCSYALSPFQQGEPCYVLLWEGALGDFYEIDAKLNIRHLGQVMTSPGTRFAFLYALADPDFPISGGELRPEDPGRLMAACAFGENGPADEDEQALIDQVLSINTATDPLRKSSFVNSPFFNIGTDSQKLKNLATKLSDAIFDRFHQFAEKNLNQSYPLLIAGGCGLNGHWNTRWKESGLFREVFIPPTTGDSGCAIGTAVDAMRHFTGRAKLDWSVYSGQSFCDDKVDTDGITMSELNLKVVAQALMDGQIIGWTRGNCEIGPRALGNRSILAAPFSSETRVRLNRIKGRALNSPVAPSVLQEDAVQHFDLSGSSPYMLDFHRVKNPDLAAITHVDGSARVQTVERDQNPFFYDLLNEFKTISGVGVLCNTSLNFKNSGFINKTSDLAHYARQVGLDGFVAGNTYYKIDAP
ncbi:carbamoyltransferase C-terminal domain-containing protein [Roseibium sp. RKSG952]|uniref:carbamoyltransferase C-terminal domain-containing protein n=1 Tax=Roseibium sp. RKSG952 TaxID=2529384 RepID=UPI0012BC7F68|nr:carbamoyltransferase C-terminal domain-containing protein [Roseibium sp. RKSG952]MTI00848.1 proline dehydrogenase [Roseibium sp. RKSG952]